MAPAESVAPAPAAATSSGVQNWAESAFGTFDVVTLTGSGDDLLPLPTAKAAVVTASYQGDGNFAVSVLDAKNESTGELLVNTIGTYSGVSVYGFNALADGVNLQVQASGDWSITIAPVASAPLLATSGSGDSIYLYDGKAGRLDATTDGSGNFAITEETGKAFHYGLLVNEIGAYSGTVPISGGPSVITVTADGNWTLSAH